MRSSASERSLIAVKPSNSSKRSMNTSSRCAIHSFHSARELALSGAVISLKFSAPSALVRMTQWSPMWSTLYSTSRWRGASTVNLTGSAAGAQRVSPETWLPVSMQMNLSSPVRETPMKKLSSFSS